MTTFDYALETAMSLPPAELDDFIEILKKRREQDWRKDTAKYYQAVKNDIKAGKLKPVNAKQAIDELNDNLKSDK